MGASVALTQAFVYWRATARNATLDLNLTPGDFVGTIVDYRRTGAILI